MNLPSRGLRPSATTIRNAGLFFAPTRFNRILTAINHHSRLRWPHPDHLPFKGFTEKRGEPRLGSPTWQVLFLRFLRPRPKPSSRPPRPSTVAVAYLDAGARTFLSAATHDGHNGLETGW